VFGRVLSGFRVFEAIAKVPTNSADRPKKACVIVDCGAIKVVSQDDAAAQARDEGGAGSARRGRQGRGRAEAPVQSRRTVPLKDGDQTGDSVAASVRGALLRQNLRAAKRRDKAAPIKHMFDALDADADVACHKKRRQEARRV
jgi:hypothetical protein